MSVEIIVNGRARAVLSDPSTPLIYVLRNELGLTGAKIGCAKEQCGACAVLVNGKAALSCDSPVGQFAGAAIETPESDNSRAVHLAREAFVEAGAAQCGYCIPGMVIAAAGLLNAKGPHDEAAIRTALQPHLCRCGTHVRVLQAVRNLVARAIEP